MSKSAPLVKRNRDAKGRLLPGHKLGGPGYPLARRMAKLKAAVIAAATEPQVKRIMRKLAAQAEAGDVAAAKVWLQYTIGKPSHDFDPRQGLLSSETKGQAVEYTPEEELYIAKALVRRAEARLRGQGVIETDGEEVDENG